VGNDPNSDICEPCWKLGIPCSWTPSALLLNKPDAFSGDLSMSLANLEACKPHDIFDPGYTSFDIIE